MDQASVKFVRFPTIEAPQRVFPHLMSASQFIRFDKQTKTSIYDHNLPLPIITLRGTVKLHGANCSIVQTRVSKPQKITHFQSRNKILRPEPGKDYMGFATHMSTHPDIVDDMFKQIFLTRSKARGKTITPMDVAFIAIFGEWCGGNIQRDIGISQFETMFIVFAVKIVYHPSFTRRKPDDQVEWMDVSVLKDVQNEKARIFNIHHFDTFEVTINLGNEQSIDVGKQLMEDLTLEVQEQCPVAKKLGAKDVLTNGEGIVWQVVQVKAPPKSYPNPNLKLERFITPTCWMKTRDIKPKTSLSSIDQQIGSKQTVADYTDWRRNNKKTLQAPDITFDWETADHNFSKAKQTLPILNVRVTWPSEKSYSTVSTTTEPPLEPLSVSSAATGLRGSCDVGYQPFKLSASTSPPVPFLSPERLSPGSLTSEPIVTSSMFLSAPAVNSILTDPNPANSFTAKQFSGTVSSTGSPSIIFRSSNSVSANSTPAGVFSTDSPTIKPPSVDPFSVKAAVANHRSDAIFNVHSSIDSLVHFITPDHILKQGLHEMDNEWLLPRHVRRIGFFIEWVVKDVFKEQGHRIDHADFDHKEVAAAISAKATKWYLGHLSKDWWVMDRNMAVGTEVFSNQ